MEKNNSDGKTRLQRLLEGDIPAFMEDNSFLTPWKWDPTKNNEVIAPSSQKKQLDFGADHESYFSYAMVPTEKNEIIAPAPSSQKKDLVYGAESSFHHDMEDKLAVEKNKQDKLIIEKKEEDKPAVEKKKEDNLIIEKKKEDKPAVEKKKEDKLIIDKKKEDKPAVEKKKEDKPMNKLIVNNQRMMKVSDLRPDMEGINMILKVLDVKKVARSVSPQVTESLIGDETGIIIFRAYGNDQIIRVKEGTTIRLKNAKIMMFKDSMRLKVNKPEDIEEVSHANFTVKEDMNYSLIQYERVHVA